MLWLVVTTLIQPLVSLPAWRRTHHPFSAAGSICAAIALRPWRGVLALDFKTRKIVWRYADKDTRFPYYSSAALSGGRVILGGRDKIVRALDMKTGREAWRFATRARVDSSPVIAGGRVYIGSNDGRLYVLDAATGRKISEFDAGAGLTASPAIAGGKLIIGSQDGTLYALG